MSQPLGPRVHRLGPEQLGPYVNVKGIFVLGVLPDPVVHPLDAPELLENSSDAVPGEPTEDVRRTLLAARAALYSACGIFGQVGSGRVKLEVVHQSSVRFLTDPECETGLPSEAWPRIARISPPRRRGIVAGANVDMRRHMY